MDTTIYLAYVDNGEAKQIWPRSSNGSMRLTTISVEAAQLPEKNKLYLDKCTGRAVIISGLPNGNWIGRPKLTKSPVH